MPAAETLRGRYARLDRVDQIESGLERRVLPPPRDRARDLPGEALLAVAAEELREPALVPFVHDLARVELLLGVHAHVERRVVRVGEAALPGVHLHRGDAEVEVDDVCGEPLLAQ